MIEISKNLKLEKVTPATAQNFWDNSSEGSFFTNPNFLKKFNEKIDYWLVKKGNEQLCLWPISTKKNFITLPLFSYYFGPFWSDYLEKKISQHSRFSLSMQVYELFLDNFEKKYKNIHFNFPPNNYDVRYFVWKKKFKNKSGISINPKYSAVISDLDKKSMLEVYSSFSTLRRRMIIKAKKEKTILKSNSFKLNEIIELYKSTILRKNKNVIKKDLTEGIKKIRFFYHIYETDKKMISLNGFREKNTKRLISLIMLGNGKYTSNLILNLSDKKYQTTGVTALAILDSIEQAKREKMINYDFNGSNSFIGSYDKHSYGSNYRLYFEIKSKT